MTSGILPKGQYFDSYVERDRVVSSPEDVDSRDPGLKWRVIAGCRVRM